MGWWAVLRSISFAVQVHRNLILKALPGVRLRLLPLRQDADARTGRFHGVAVLSFHWKSLIMTTAAPLFLSLDFSEVPPPIGGTLCFINYSSHLQHLFCTRPCSKHFTNINSFHTHSHPVKSTPAPASQMRKLSHRASNYLPKGIQLTWQSWDLNLHSLALNLCS